jgi:hypothetical protein
MTRNRSSRIIIALIMAVIMLVPATMVYADSPGGEMMGPEKMMDGDGPAMGTGPADPPPIAIIGPRLSPPPISHSSVLDPGVIYNNLLVPPGVPVQSLEADAADGGRAQEKPGRGIRQTATDIGFGLLLYESPNVCNDFNAEGNWASLVNGEDGPALTDIWTDWYAGWAPYAIDNGYYQAKNVTFSMERSVGPGNNWGKGEQSAKIASNQPYAAGFGSPRIPVPKGYDGGQVQVSVKYLIWDHDTGGGMGDGWDYDWASMGVKAGADSDYAQYVNGYVRGEWAELTNTMPLGSASDVMVLLQGHSPGFFNSNIWFDDVKIAFIDADGKGKYLKDCKLEESVK